MHLGFTSTVIAIERERVLKREISADIAVSPRPPVPHHFHCKQPLAIVNGN
jgi:hypothetical protein